METVDFSTRFKQRARDHAGWSAYMFRDIGAAHEGAQAIALIRATEADSEFVEVQNGLAILSNEAKVVNWLLDEQREEFLAEVLENATR